MNLHIGHLSVLVILLIDSVYLQNFPCVNPRNVRGLCVPLNSCGFLVNILQKYPHNEQANNFIRQSICGYDQRSRVEYACCPNQQQQQTAQERNFNKPSGAHQFQRQTLSGSGNQFQQQTQSKTSLLPKCNFDLNNRIFGGARSSISDFGFLVLLRYARAGSPNAIFKCAGSLINNRYVITAAHCVHPKLLQTTKLVGARIGESNLITDIDCETNSEGRRICAPQSYDVPIEEVILHEKYLPNSLNQHNDIALVRLSRNIQFNEFVTPICLQKRSLKVTDIIGQTLTVTGFGQTEKSPSSYYKLYVNLKVVENAVCDRVFRADRRRLNETQFCAGGVKNEDSCKGDSGGPVMKLVNENNELFWVLYGIVSYGAVPCGQENFPGVYTKVDQYIDWIEKKLRP